MYPDPFGGEPEPDLTDLDALIDELERQAALLTAVATGGPRIDDVKREYWDRRRRLAAALERRGLEYPFPWQDLWQWYGYWTADLAGYAPRRAKIRELAAPVIEALERQRSGLSVSDPGSGSVTWADLDARLAGLSAELDGAVSRDDLQDVGRRAREILIDCAALPADPSLVPVGGVPPKAGDAKAWLDLFLTARAQGGHREEFRRLVRAPGIWPRRSHTAISGASTPSPRRRQPCWLSGRFRRSRPRPLRPGAADSLSARRDADVASESGGGLLLGDHDE
jgi:hypothetical protein